MGHRRCRSCRAKRRGPTAGSTWRTGRADRPGPAGRAWAGNPGSGPSAVATPRAGRPGRRPRPLGQSPARNRCRPGRRSRAAMRPGGARWRPAAPCRPVAWPRMLRWPGTALCRPWAARHEMARRGLARPGATWLEPIRRRATSWPERARCRPWAAACRGAADSRVARCRPVWALQARWERGPTGARRLVRKRAGPGRPPHAGKKGGQQDWRASAGPRPAAGLAPAAGAPLRPAGHAAARRRSHPQNPWRERIPPSGWHRADRHFVGFTGFRAGGEICNRKACGRGRGGLSGSL